MSLIPATDLKALLLAAAGEVAVLDVREESRFGSGHLLAASSAPLGHLEVEAPRLVPRRATPVVLYSDAEDDLAECARAVLLALGYTHLQVLDGGLAACEAAGFEIFNGLHTPSKVLAAFVQQELGIPEISPEELAAKLSSGEEVHVIDCRPQAEYRRGTIPGAVHCPGGDLPRSNACAQTSPRTYVITCAGRSRGLTSAQLLREQNVSGKVFALERGTMGWELSGRQLEKGAHRIGVMGSAQKATDHMLENILEIRTQHQIGLLTPDQLRTYGADTNRTTVLFDIRSRQEYEAEHIAGARHVAGGQLIHNIDMHLATRGARLVVCDDDGVRATNIALWLKRMGLHEVFVATMMEGPHETSLGSQPPMALNVHDNTKLVSAPELDVLLRQGKAVVLDLANSRQYRKGHIPGAWFCKRVQLGSALPQFAESEIVVLTSDCGRAAIGASQEHTNELADLRVLEGGTEAWRAAGCELVTGLERLCHEPDDVYLKPSEFPGGTSRMHAMEAYLGGTQEALEKGLKDGSLPLRALPLHLDREGKLDSMDVSA